MPAFAESTAALLDGPVPAAAGSTAALLDGLLAARWPGSAVIDSLLAAVVHGPVALSSPIVNAGFWFLEMVAGVVAL